MAQAALLLGMRHLKHLHELRISFRALPPLLRGSFNALAVFLYEIQQVPTLPQLFNTKSGNKQRQGCRTWCCR